MNAIPDLALLAMHKQIVGQAPAAMNIIHGQVFAVGQCAFTGHAAFVQIHQPFLKLGIVVPARNVNRADPAIQPARSNKIMIDRHNGDPPWQVQTYGGLAVSFCPVKVFQDIAHVKRLQAELRKQTAKYSMPFLCGF
jgi:hypothetical protein